MSSRAAWRKKWAPYKSGLESSVADSMEEQGIEFRYEPKTFEYRKRVVKGVCDACGGDKTSQRCTYLPDFVVGEQRATGGRVYIETKGFFAPHDRAKLVAVKQDNPDLDLRLIFGSNNKLNKKKDARYSDWCEQHNFPYYVGKEFPSSWASGLQVDSNPGPLRDEGSHRKYKRGKYIRSR